MSQSDDDRFSELFEELGRRGGLARAKKLSPEQRKKIATKASKAAAKKRTADAKRRAKKRHLT